MRSAARHAPPQPQLGVSGAGTRLRAIASCAVATVALSLAAGCGSDGTGPPPIPPRPRCESTVDTTGAASVSFRTQIVPLLERNGCSALTCHGGTLVSSNYSVASRDTLLHPGDQALALGMCAVRPGAPDSSYVIWKVAGRAGIRGARMPLNRPALAPQDLALLRAWIEEGARDN